MSNAKQEHSSIDLLASELDVFFFQTVPAVFYKDQDVLMSVVSDQRGFIGTKQSYADFKLELEFWTDQDANSGVYIRCQDITAFSSRSCYEVNIADTHATEASRTGAIVGFAPPSVEISTVGRWTKLEILATKNHLRVFVDGIETVDLTDDSYAAGHIALQYGGNSKQINFRNILLTEL